METVVSIYSPVSFNQIPDELNNVFIDETGQALTILYLYY